MKDTLNIGSSIEFEVCANFSCKLAYKQQNDYHNAEKLLIPPGNRIQHGYIF